VKDLAEKGKLNGELFWLSRIFFRYLQMMPKNGSSRLEPRPLRVLEETKLVLEVAQGDPVREFIESETEPAKNYGDASNISDVKKAIIEYAGGQHLRLSDTQLQERLAMHGIQQESNGQRRVLTYKYPGTRIKKAIKLRSEEDVAAA
jgi:hypothetical protein